MSGAYPDPPHLIMGIVILGSASSGLEALRSVIEAAGGVAPTRGGGDGRGITGGPLLLEVAFEDADPRSAGLQVVVSGELLGALDQIEMTGDEQAEADATRQFAAAVLRDACEAVRPLYGGLDVEWRVPHIEGLGSGHERLPADLYWAIELDECAPDLTAEIARAYGVPAIPFAAGTAVCGGGILDPSRAPTPEPISAGRAAAIALRRAVDLFLSLGARG